MVYPLTILVILASLAISPQLAVTLISIGLAVAVVLKNDGHLTKLVKTVKSLFHIGGVK